MVEVGNSLPRCGTCKWWVTIGLDSEWEDTGWAPGHMVDENGITIHGMADGRPVMAEGAWGWCSRASEFGPRKSSDLFYVVDGSKYVAKMGTRSDFGCVEHKPTGEASSC